MLVFVESTFARYSILISTHMSSYRIRLKAMLVDAQLGGVYESGYPHRVGEEKYSLLIAEKSIKEKPESSVFSKTRRSY